MDWNFVLSVVLKVVGSALGTVLITLATILFTKLKTKIGEAKLNTYIDVCVKAAEQLYPNLGEKTGPEKYQYVLECVKSKYPKLDEGYLKPLIEGAVFAVSEEVRQIAEQSKPEEITTTTTTKTSGLNNIKIG